MLTRFNCQFYERPFEVSMMGRSLLLAEALGRDLVVATAHFESLNNAKARKCQMEECFGLVRKSGIKNAMVVGDFNFDSTWEHEEAVITQNGMRDVVHQFYNKSALSMHKTPRFPPWRPDKVVAIDGQEMKAI